MTKQRQARDAIACLAHECEEILDLEPQVCEAVLKMKGGRRLQVTRDRVLFGSKKKPLDVTVQVREDIAALIHREESETGDGA